MNTKMVVVVGVSLVPILVDAQTPASDAVLRRALANHSITVDGSRNPENIPYVVAVENAIDRLAAEQQQGAQAFSQYLRARFSGSDADFQILSELVAQNAEFVANVHNEESQSVDQACEGLLAADAQLLDSRQVARTFEQIKDKRLASMDEHYKAAISKLSPSMRASFASHVETNVRPQMVWGTVDNVGLATELPQDFLRHRIGTCEQWLAKPSTERTWKRRSRMQGIDVDTATNDD